MASASNEPCWCVREEIPKSGLAALFARAGRPFPAAPEVARCICAACAEQARLIAREDDAGRAGS